jgi:protein-tyrosine phosphatase
MPEIEPPDKNSPLLTISPKRGVVLLLLGGHIMPFHDLGHVSDFVDQLKDELDSLKTFVSDGTAIPIGTNYAQEVIDSWEKALKKQGRTNRKRDTESSDQPQNPKKPKKTIKEKTYRSKDSNATDKSLQKPEQKEPRRKKPTETKEKEVNKIMMYQKMTPSKSRVESLKRYAVVPVPDDFDPDVISWVMEDIAITDWEGGLKAKDLGHYVINVAEEVRSNADAKMPVNPPNSKSEVIATRDDVERVADRINDVLEDGNQKVVVHCYMGMERSVLSVVWYMHKYMGMGIDEAYEQICMNRPIAADRRHWIGL